MDPTETLRHHVTGAIERGEAVPIVGIPSQPVVTDKGWTLHYTANGVPVRVGDVVPDFRGDDHEVLGGTCPHKPGSSGYVETMCGGYKGRFYASVIDARWVQD